MSIKTGDRGASVRSLQNQLRSKGFDPGTSDGVFGKKTAKAVKEFQASKGLTVDAKVGRDTTRALQAERNRDSFETGPAARRGGTTRPAAARTGATRPEARPAAAQRTTAPRRGEAKYREIQRFVQERGWTTTSTTGGRHLGRAHREGRAVDVRTRDHTRAQGDALIRQARAAGYTVIDERGGGNAAWSGPHIHIQAN